MLSLFRLSLALVVSVSVFAEDVKEESEWEIQNPPLWELGVGGGATYTPDYPGSDQNHFWAIPFPFGIYRGEIIHSNRRGETRARFIKSAGFEVNFSAAGGLPSSSAKNRAREGMPDLEWLGQFGPRLTFDLISFPERSLLRVGFPIRFAFSTNLHHLKDRGIVFAPEILYDLPNFFGSRFDAFMLFTMNFADRRFSNYFYEVEPAFATAGRHAYEARGGYLLSDISAGLSMPLYKSRVKLYSFASISSLDGAANDGSPLFQSKFNSSISMVLIWIFAKSEARVIAED